MIQQVTTENSFAEHQALTEKLSKIMLCLDERTHLDIESVILDTLEQLTDLLGCEYGRMAAHGNDISTINQEYYSASDGKVHAAPETAKEIEQSALKQLRTYSFVANDISITLELTDCPSHRYTSAALEDFLHKLSLLLKYKQQQKSFAAINKEMQRYRLSIESAFDSIPDGIVIFSRNYAITYANKAFLQQTGKSFDQVQNQTLEECMGAAAMPFLSVSRQTMELGRPTTHFRTTLLTLHGEERKFELNAAPIGENELSVDGVILVIKDITRLVALEENLIPHYECGDMIGESKAFSKVAAIINRLSETDTTVLVTGESGTGKELVTEALHFKGPRADHPLIKVNCTALSEALLESELFGHIKGAFTGAIRESEGRIAAAEGGTLFLDEIGDISPQIQIKLLRFLENKEYERVGCTETRKANVRVVTATNADLLAKVREGTFREDLYYRLNVFPIELPPLRERKEDIPLLAHHFLEYFNVEFGRSVLSICPECIRSLVEYSWPGNVRELRHVIEYAFVLCTGSTLNAKHFPLPIIEQRIEDVVIEEKPSHTPEQMVAKQLLSSPPAQVEEKQTLSIELVQQALDAAGGKKAKAARMLGVSRTTLYRWLQKQA
jgi:PAS domain S-box-containing protein